MILKIAICDDESIYRECVIRECNRYFQSQDKRDTYEVSLTEFASGEDFIAQQQQFDILFLDVEMPKRDGIFVKEYFEKKGIDTRIIFLTSHQERVIEAFGKNVFFFLCKPLHSQNFDKAMDKVIEDINGDIIEIEDAGDIIIVPVKQIKYVEAQDKYTMLITQKEKHILRKAMKDWEKILPLQNFVRVHKSFLVNFEYFVIDKDEVILDKNKRIKISRKNKTEIIEKYKSYLRVKAGKM